MSTPQSSDYIHTTTNRTRAANQPNQTRNKKKATIAPAPEPPAKKARKKSAYHSPLADQHLYDAAEIVTQSQAGIPRRLPSRRSESTGGSIAGPSQLSQASRFKEGIGRHTVLTEGLEDDQPVNMSGVPIYNQEAETIEDEITLAPARNTNVEQLADFVEGKRAATYSHCIIDHLGPPPDDLICDLCERAGTAVWRCDSCQCNRDLCTPCLRRSHMSTPFHRVRYLTGKQYREAWLRDAGVFIQLCPKARGLNPCPGYVSGQIVMDRDVDLRPPPFYGSARESAAATEGSAAAAGAPAEAAAVPDVEEDVLPDDDGIELDEGEVEAQGHESDSDSDGDDLQEGMARARGREAKIWKDSWGYPVLVVVHEVDVHQIGVAYCTCQAGGHVPRDEQLLRFGGIYPATRKDPRTGFTLRGLAYHQVDRLAAKTAPQAMYRKLRRHTSPLHPSTVSDRYPELIRVLREHTVTNNLIIHGFAHQELDSWHEPPPGGLFNKCIVCPTKDNLPKGYKDDPNSWAIFYSFVHDGNFSAQHTISRQPGNNVPIYPGTGAFQHPDEVAQILASAVSDKDVQREEPELFEKDQPCHKHQAAALTGKTRNKITDIRGIGAWACSRHGCFCAGGTCNYEKGESQPPADAALDNVFKINTDTSLVDRLQLLYDIWCRYGIHLRERFNRSPSMSWPEFAEVLGSVGVWHIYGHVFECYGRYSNLYSRRTGIIDGEVLETLWSILNSILESCRGMSLAHREEVISMFQSDSNLHKTLGMVTTLKNKFVKYFAEEAERQKLVDKLTSCTTPENVEDWEFQRQRLEDMRIDDPLAADEVFSKENTQVTSRKDAELELLEEEALNPEGRGLVQAVINAIDIQVDQLKLQALDKQAVSPGERRTIASTRTRLHNRVNKANEDMAAALGSKPTAGELEVVRLIKLMAEDEWDDGKDVPAAQQRYGLRVAAEFRPVDLPSSRGQDWRTLNVAQGAEDDTALRLRAMAIEVRLLVARMDEELGLVRTTIVDQANTYLVKIRSRGGRGTEKRGYNLANQAYEEVRSQGRTVRIHAQIYNACVLKLQRLAHDMASTGDISAQSLLDRYFPLASSDLVCSTETYSTRGTTSKFKLPWFWRMVPRDAHEDADLASERDEKFVSEFFRIRWINAKCALTRCQEELIIIHFEMQMCYLGYRSMGKRWHDRRKAVKGSRAHRFLAEEYSSHWKDMAAFAKETFNLCYEDVIHDDL